MPNRPTSRLAPALIVVGVLCAVLAIYVAGYFYASKALTPWGGKHGRVFPSKLFCAVYSPAARLEASLREIRVELWYPTGKGDHDSWGTYDP